MLYHGSGRAIAGRGQSPIKKRPRCHASRTRAFRFVVPPCFTQTSRPGPLDVQESDTSALSRAPPSQPMRQAQSVRSSKTMFSNAVCTPSHQIGLSVTLFIAYSSFQRFSHMKLYLIYNGLFDLSTPTTFFIVILLEPAVGTKILPSPALFCAYVSMESR